ncbi:Reverse transcriptase (RNA-dependent DNA polymerase), partial [Rhizoctonia solani]
MLCNLISIDLIFYDLRFTITNIYLHGSTANKTLNALVNTPADPCEAQIYCGDFNLHHPLWSLDGAPAPSIAANADTLAEWILANKLEVINSPNTPTRRGRRGQRDSIIDLTITNNTVSQGNLILEWESTSFGAMGSNHNSIGWKFTICPPKDTQPPEELMRFVIDMENQDKWIKAITRLLKENPPLQIYNSTEDIELGAWSILKAMSNATDCSMKLTKVHKRQLQAPWWNAACSDMVATLEHSVDSKSRSSALGHLRSTIRTARRNFADCICLQVSPDNIFSLTKWSKGERHIPLPPLVMDGRTATIPDDQALMLKSVFFPTTAPPVDMSPLGIPVLATRAHHNITANKIASALSGASNKLAPGAFGLNYQLLKWLFESHPKSLVDLYNACLIFGYHPKCLCNALVAVIPKPRKPDMLAPKAYRPILLLETLSKCLEEIMAARIIFEIGKHNILPYTQFGGRDNLLCVDGGLALCHNIYAAWLHGKFASLLTLDISGYFNNVNHSRLMS